MAESAASSKLADRMVHDATGSRIPVPDHITRVIPAGSQAAILLYTVAPDTLAGCLGAPARPAESAFLTAESAALPQIG